MDRVCPADCRLSNTHTNFNFQVEKERTTKREQPYTITTEMIKIKQWHTLNIKWIIHILVLTLRGLVLFQYASSPPPLPLHKKRMYSSQKSKIISSRTVCAAQTEWNAMWLVMCSGKTPLGNIHMVHIYLKNWSVYCCGAEMIFFCNENALAAEDSRLLVSWRWRQQSLSKRLHSNRRIMVAQDVSGFRRRSGRELRSSGVITQWVAVVSYRRFGTMPRNVGGKSIDIVSQETSWPLISADCDNLKYRIEYYCWLGNECVRVWSLQPEDSCPL